MIAESAANDSRLVTLEGTQRDRLRRAVERRLPPRAPRRADRRARRLLRRLRARRRSRAHLPRGVRVRAPLFSRSGTCTTAGAPQACPASASSSSTRTTTRSATEHEATGSPSSIGVEGARVAAAAVLLSPVRAAAVHGRGVRRDEPVPLLRLARRSRSRRGRPPGPGRGVRGASSPTRFPIRRRRRPSRRPGSTGAGATRNRTRAVCCSGISDLLALRRRTAVAHDARTHARAHRRVRGPARARRAPRRDRRVGRARARVRRRAVRDRAGPARAARGVSSSTLTPSTRLPIAMLGADYPVLVTLPACSALVLGT